MLEWVRNWKTLKGYFFKKSFVHGKAKTFNACIKQNENKVKKLEPQRHAPFIKSMEDKKVNINIQIHAKDKFYPMYSRAN